MMVAVFGTMAADVIHHQLGVSFGMSTSFCALAVAATFWIWHRREHTLDVHSITTRRREVFYWVAVSFTFALGTAAGDLTASQLHFGFLGSIVLFAIVIAVPALGCWRFHLNSVIAFWWAYITTRPLGASIADWVSKPAKAGGLAYGDGPVAAALLMIALALVTYTAVRRSTGKSPGPAEPPASAVESPNDAETTVRPRPSGRFHRQVRTRTGRPGGRRQRGRASVTSWPGSRTCVPMSSQHQPAHGGRCSEGDRRNMTVDTLPAEAPSTDFDTPDVLVPSVESTAPESVPAPDAPAAVASAGEKPKKAPAKKAAGKKTKTLELTLTVTGTADGEWRAELKQGTTYLARNLAVAAAAVSRAAKELHEDLSTPIDEVIEEARSQQAAKVAALEAQLEAARKALADLD
jgi:hypothetical protein